MALGCTVVSSVCLRLRVCSALALCATRRLSVRELVLVRDHVRLVGHCDDVPKTTATGVCTGLYARPLFNPAHAEKPHCG